MTDIIKFPSIDASRNQDQRLMVIVDYDKKPLYRMLAIGELAALANGVVYFRDRAGNEFQLSDEETNDIYHAFIRASCAAAERRRYLRGEYTLRIERTESGVQAIFHGQNIPLRKSTLRSRHPTCEGCKEKLEPPSEVWICATNHNDWHSLAVCESCVERLAAARMDIREIPAPEAPPAAETAP